MDTRNRIIVGADQFLPNRNADAQAAVELPGRLKLAYQLTPRTLGADKGMLGTIASLVTRTEGPSPRANHG